MMPDWLTRLLKLQEHDLKVRAMREQADAVPDYLENLKKRRAEMVARVNAAAEKARSLKQRREETEARIAALAEENAKLQRQSALVKKNDEYQAMLSTVALNEKKSDELETLLITLIDDYECEKAAFLRLKTQTQADIESLREEYAENTAFADRLKQDIAAMEPLRAPLESGIPGDLLARYGQLLAGGDGMPPVAAVRGGVCGGCGMQITPQSLAVITRGQPAVCDNCMHLIYLCGDEG